MELTLYQKLPYRARRDQPSSGTQEQCSEHHTITYRGLHAERKKTQRGLCHKVGKEMSARGENDYQDELEDYHHLRLQPCLNVSVGPGVALPADSTASIVIGLCAA
mmetsp:Transcript_25594/g.55620  ORF Transcript_25594/g.55620 Transcript_25594/m.55620 type:complete len:106 (-) Transcript_25594:1350-1667(-)